MNRVNSKRESYSLLERGAYGNKLRTWGSLSEILDSGYSGTVSMRYKLGWSGFYAYEVNLSKIPSVIKEWVSKGANQKQITFNESAPDDLLMMQGELMRDYRGYVLTYSTEKIKMREAMKNPEHASGLTAKIFLEHYLSPSSYSDMQALLDMFPDSVIEFSAYSKFLGNIPWRNTVIWEVRNY